MTDDDRAHLLELWQRLASRTDLIQGALNTDVPNLIRLFEYATRAEEAAMMLRKALAVRLAEAPREPR